MTAKPVAVNECKHKFIKVGFKATVSYGLRQRYFCRLCGRTTYDPEKLGKESLA